MMRFLLIISMIFSFRAMAENNAKPYIEFLQATATATALAETPHPDPVKFMTFGKDQTGEVVVKGIWLGEDHWTANKTENNITAIAHFHNREMEQRPEKEDFSYPSCSKLYCFIVSNDGSKIWEISIKSNGNTYRDVSSEKYGGWVEVQE